MSWSFYAIGAAGAVRKKARQDFGSGTCAQPEEAIRQNVGLAIDLALAALPPDYAVKVTAGGSQSNLDGGAHSNSVKLEVEPVYGYVK